ncbi:Crp/Fnr family transcriptional regulator [Desulfococcus sp.]|uniref:Crp/Fnr family transcriptional regulator n=1 Tax=Desulfococcus sp. TaxID=2025834 RepID=UPI003D117A09
MAVDLNLLEQLEMFEGLEHGDLEMLKALFNSIRVREGELLTRRGDPAQNFYIILSGNFMISFKDGKAFTLHEKGDVIGMSTMLEPFDYRGTTLALTDGEVLMAAGDKFNELLRGNARLSETIMRRLNDVIAQRRPFFNDEGASSDADSIAPEV